MTLFLYRLYIEWRRGWGYANVHWTKIHRLIFALKWIAQLCGENYLMQRKPSRDKSRDKDASWDWFGVRYCTRRIDLNNAADLKVAKRERNAIVEDIERYTTFFKSRGLFSRYIYRTALDFMAGARIKASGFLFIESFSRRIDAFEKLFSPKWEFILLLLYSIRSRWLDWLICGNPVDSYDCEASLKNTCFSTCPGKFSVLVSVIGRMSVCATWYAILEVF